MSYGDQFDKKALQNLVTAIFDEYLLSEKFVEAIFDAGTTSMNEFFHSMLVHRRLVVKAENIHVTSLNYELAFSIGTLYFNLGERDVFDRVFDYFGLKVCPIALTRFGQNERLAKLRQEYNLAKKPETSAKRAKQQKQYTTTTNSRKNYVYETLAETHEREKREKALSQNVTIRKKRQKSPEKSTDTPITNFIPPPPNNITLRRSKRQKL